MSRQNDARQEICRCFNEFLSQVLAPSLADAQNQASSKAVFAAIWPALTPEHLIAMDGRDERFLVRCGGITEELRDVLAERIFQIAAEAFGRSNTPNPHLRGSKLRALVNEQVDRQWDTVRRAADALFEERGADRFGDAGSVQASCLQMLNDKCVEALRSSQTSEDERRRWLKILAAMLSPGGTPADRHEQFKRLSNGSTAAFPFIPKYLSRQSPAKIRDLPALAMRYTTGGFTPALTSRFPEAILIRDCLERYQSRDGVLMRLIDPTGPINGALARQFDELPTFVPRRVGGIVMHKEHALELSRRDGFKMPDGVICAVTLSTLIESVLRQAVTALGLGGGVNERPAAMVKRVHQGITLRTKTHELLETLFDARNLSPRDAMAHGAFFADREETVGQTVATLSHCLRLLVEDLAASGAEGQLFGAARWDATKALEAGSLTVVDEQRLPALNLIDQLQDDDARQHLFKMLGRLIPDKHMMGKAAFLLWVNGQKLEHESQTDETLDFAALLAGIITLEELFRAVYEVHREPVLVVSPQADYVKCELAILDDRPGQLLHEPALRRVFGTTCDDEGFLRSLRAVRDVRDKVMHGAWVAIPRPYNRYAHLIMKVLFALCGTVDTEAPNYGARNVQGGARTSAT